MSQPKDIYLKNVDNTTIIESEYWFNKYNENIFNPDLALDPEDIDVPSKSEFLAFGNSLRAFGYDFNIKDFYSDYIYINTLTFSSEPMVEGRMHPTNIKKIITEYIKDKEIDVNYYGSYLSYSQLISIVKNNWPTIVWYIEKTEENIPLEDRWQFAQIGLAYKADDNYIYIFNPIDKESTKYRTNDFEQYWLRCGAYAIVI